MAARSARSWNFSKYFGLFQWEKIIFCQNAYFCSKMIFRPCYFYFFHTFFLKPSLIYLFEFVSDTYVLRINMKNNKLTAWFNSFAVSVLEYQLKFLMLFLNQNSLFVSAVLWLIIIVNVYGHLADESSKVKGGNL